MKLIKKGEGEVYEGAGHFNCWNLRKLAPGKDSKRLLISVSHFLPSGGAEMSSSPSERIYVDILGSITIKGKKEEYRLEAGDMIYMAPGEDRSIQVNGDEPATILVAVAKLD